MNKDFCPFERVCPELKKINGIYGFCIMFPEKQKKCNFYRQFVNNPSYRRKNLNG